MVRPNIKTMSSAIARRWLSAVAALAPGVTLTALIAMAATYAASRYGGPTMLYALLFGIALNALSADEKCAPGIAFSAKVLLRIGVALLGAQIALAQVAGLGLAVIAIVIGGVSITLIGGAMIGRWAGLSGAHAVLSAGAVAICGASAALAISAVLPRQMDTERNTSLTVVGVTALSTVAMMVYPVLTQGLVYSDIAAGVFLGATIHDVAQVIGAGYMISDPAGQTAAIVKLMRVSCLVPAVFLIGFVFRQRCEPGADGRRPALVPGFLIAFVMLMVLNSAGLIAPWIGQTLSTMSHWCLVIAVAALGVKTTLKDLWTVGPKPVAVLALQTLLLAFFVVAALSLVK